MLVSVPGLGRRLESGGCARGQECDFCGPVPGVLSQELWELLVEGLPVWV